MNAIPSSIFRAYDIRSIVNEQLNFDIVELISRAIGSEALANDINTLLVEFDEGWRLVRASNTSPALLLRFEATNKEYLEKINPSFKALLYLADNNIDLDF